MHEQPLMHDWNEAGERWERPAFRVRLFDETLRDGLQAPAARSPSLDERVEVLHLMDRLGIDTVNLGLPGAGDRVARDATRLAEEIRAAGLRVAASCAARAIARDIIPIVVLSQKAGIPVEVCAFVGSSPVRQYAEDWTIEAMERHTADAVGLAVEHGLQVTLVTEDTARAQPGTLRRLFLAAIGAGARRLCLCDTAGHATPAGTANLVRYAREVVRASGADVALDWHGHSDRGLAVANALGAVRAGASRVHACALGLGERAGNTPMDQVLVNLRLLGWIDNDLSALDAYCAKVSAMTGVPIPPGYPAVGRDAFRTATGMHAAALLKARRRGDAELADRVVSAVPAALVGRRQEVEVGPASGVSNVVWWLERHGVEATPERTQAVYQRARSASRALSEPEIRAVLDALEETRGS